MRGLIGFLVKYWLLVGLIPSVFVPTFLFFFTFTDIADFTFSAVVYEITKYLIPAILIFIAASIIFIAFFVLVDLLILRLMLQRLRYWSFKIVFIVTSILLIIAPAVIWYSFKGAINVDFINIILPTYIFSAILWGAYLIKRSRYNALKTLVG